MECYGESYTGDTPSWTKGLIPAKYEDFQQIWQSISFNDFDDLFFKVQETCNLGEIIFEEEHVEKTITRALQSLGFSYTSAPPYEDKEAKDAWWAARKTAQDTLDIAKIWWDALKPMTSPALSSGQLVFNISSHGGPDSAEWIDCTLYERIDVDDYSEYPGQKLCDVVLFAYLLVDSPILQESYQIPVSYYVNNVEIDEESVHQVTEISYEPDY